MKKILVIAVIVSMFVGCSDEGAVAQKPLSSNKGEKIELTQSQSRYLEFMKKDSNEGMDKPIILNEGERVKLVSTHGKNLTIKRVESGLVIEGDEDKIVLFDIFGTFCEPCKREAPALMTMQLEYSEKVVVIGLSYYEDVDNAYIIENFQKPHNAYYFIAANSINNKALVDTILHDIDYERLIALPFKVVANRGKYEKVTDKWEKKDDVKYYIGDIGTSIIKEDIDRIMKNNG